MEDCAMEAETLLHPKEEEALDAGEDESRSSASLMSHILPNLISKLQGEEEEEEKQVDDEGENRAKKGGLLGNLISNLVSPPSPKAGGIYGENKVENSIPSSGKTEDGELENGKEKEEESENSAEDNEQGNGEEQGGGGIIDNIVSHLPTSLSGDAAPTTDEASILIHAIIHD